MLLLILIALNDRLIAPLILNICEKTKINRIFFELLIEAQIF